MSALKLVVFIMSCCGIFGSIVSVVFILLIIRPVYSGMYEDVFLKIGGNGNMWEVYKYFTLCKSLLKLDFLISAEFMITIFFLSYNTKDSLYFIAIDIFVCLAIIGNNIHGHLLINRKLYKQYVTYVVIRDIIENYKLYRTITSSLGYTLALQEIPLDNFGSDTSSFRYSGIIFEVIG